MASKKNKSGSRDDDVSAYMEIFSWSFRKQSKDYDRLISLQQSYDNIVAGTTWPTDSRIPIAAFFESVEKALPIALDGIFSQNNRLRLVSLEEGVTIDQIVKSELALRDLVTYRMKAQKASIPVVKDVFKLGVGFCIIEPIYISPPSSFLVSSKGKSTRVMEVGSAVRTLRQRYLAPGQICVTPDGSNFNGDNPVSVAFFLDSYNENQFRDMYQDSVIDGEKPEMIGNPEEIIEEARSKGFTSDTSIETLINETGGISAKNVAPDDARVPCRVPVLKVYDNFKRRHLWIANGTTIVFDKSDEFQTMRCPLIKASAWLDGTRFYPMSTPEAYKKIGWVKNIIINLFLDILTKNLKRPLIYNSELFDKEPSFGPDDKIRTSAPDARLGAAYLPGPNVDATSLTFYEYINQIGNSLLGQRDYMEKNFTRGGGMAFQDLLSSTEGMNRLQWTILEMTLVENIYNQALIYLQSMVDEQGVVVRQRKTDKATGKEDIEDITVTENDLCHGYELSVDFGQKKRMGAMEKNAQLAVYDRKINSVYFDHYETAREHLCDSDEEAERQMKSRDEIRALQMQTQAAMMQQQAERMATPAVGVPAGEPEAGGETI